MKERISEFLKRENKSSALFAEEIGVQPSGISHILSGRNKPSLDFVVKMLETYPYLAVDWLLFGKGEMYKRLEIPDLFGNYPDKTEERKEKRTPVSVKEDEHSTDPLEKPSVEEKRQLLPNAEETGKPPVVARIVLFYSNNTFEEYFPGK
ncbi:MAG: helix-turn-helix transcriptional regulator [Bacteroidales bacterium]|nr:helix-turn-helix transcriptional regulator [Bacteroidales bacterium]